MFSDSCEAPFAIAPSPVSINVTSSAWRYLIEYPTPIASGICPATIP